MVNDVIISGNYLGFNKNILLLKIDDSEVHKIIKININEVLKEELEKQLKIDDKIGIKGYLDIDKNQSIIIVATKLIII